MTNEQHKYYRQAYDAYRGTSFSPDKRAVSQLAYYEQVCADFKALGKESAVERFTALWLKWMAAKARCFSPMIVGPAKFPVARMEKYNRWEQSAGEATFEFVRKVTAPPKEPRTELDYKIEAKEYRIGDVKVIQNVEDNRLQLAFPGKPDAEMIQKLKQRGFKWSPKNKVWQRQLTPNALRVIPWIFKQTKGE